MSTYLPAFLAAGAIALTYLFCIRPMRTGSPCHTVGTSRSPERVALELELARTELELLRLQHDERLWTHQS